MLISLCSGCGARVGSREPIRYCPQCGRGIPKEAEVKQAEMLVGEADLPPAPRHVPGVELACRFCGERVKMPDVPGRTKPLWITSFQCPRCRRENRFGPPTAQPVVVESEPDPLAGETGRTILETLTEIEDKLKWN